MSKTSVVTSAADITFTANQKVKVLTKIKNRHNVNVPESVLREHFVRTGLVEMVKNTTDRYRSMDYRPVLTDLGRETIKNYQSNNPRKLEKITNVLLDINSNKSPNATLGYIMNNVVAAGYATATKIPTGTRGPRPTLLEITPKGRDFLTKNVRK